MVQSEVARQKQRTTTEYDGQITTPFPLIRRFLPTPQQIREHFKLSYFEVAHEAGVNPCIVYWLEHDIGVYPLEAQAVLTALSKHTNGKHSYTFDNVRGIRFRRVLRHDATRFRRW